MNIDTYIFDIDHTLYPFSQGVLDWFEEKIDAYIASSLDISLQKANILRSEYYNDFGSTMSGLMYHHGITPASFKAAKGLVPLDVIGVDKHGLNALKESAKRKIAYTNASHRHGERVLTHLGIRDQFEALYGIDDTGYWGKPFRKSFDKVFGAENINPKTSVFFEDSHMNLAYPHSLGMKTVLIGETHFKIGNAPDYVDIHTLNLASAIEQANDL